MLKMIACVNTRFGIGDKGKLLYDIPEDLQWFKEKTLNSFVIMGSRTWDSLPRKPLPNRYNLILTNHFEKFNYELFRDVVGTDRMILGGTYLIDEQDIFKYFINDKHNDCLDGWIIGGGMVYNKYMNHCSEIELTVVLDSLSEYDTVIENPRTYGFVETKRGGLLECGIYRYYHTSLIKVE